MKQRGYCSPKSFRTFYMHHRMTSRANFNIGDNSSTKKLFNGQNNKLWVKTIEIKWSKDLELFAF